jgi:hypothetical protein
VAIPLFEFGGVDIVGLFVDAALRYVCDHYADAIEGDENIRERRPNQCPLNSSG